MSSASSPSLSFATRRWNSDGNRRSLRPISTLVGTAGQRRTRQGCAIAAADGSRASAAGHLGLVVRNQARRSSSRQNGLQWACARDHVTAAGSWWWCSSSFTLGGRPPAHLDCRCPLSLAAVPHAHYAPDLHLI